MEISTFIGLVHQVRPDAQANVTVDSRFVEDLQFSSVNSIMLVTLLQEALGQDLKEHMASLLELKTVGAACEYLEGVSHVSS